MNVLKLSKAAGDRVFEDLEEILSESGQSVGEEVRGRLRELASHSAQVGVLAAAGPEAFPELEELTAALEARMAALEAGTHVVVVAAFRKAVRRALVGAMEIALAAVI